MNLTPTLRIVVCDPQPVFRYGLTQLFHSTERFIGMDFVDLPIEFAALARSLGMRAYRIDAGDEFGAAYRDALGTH